MASSAAPPASASCPSGSPAVHDGSPCRDARTVAELLAGVAERLSLGSVTDPRRVARDVVADLLDVPRGWPLVHPDAPCDGGIAERAHAAARRIVAGAPFAHAVGRAAFRHLTLAVDARVLVPRPETELLVDIVLERDGAAGGLAIDVGTGSGAIALALATEAAFARVIATDVSLDALDVARANVRALGARPHAPVELRHGSLLAPVAGERARVVVSNPPYIAFHEAAALPRAVRDWEPGVALFSGEDGLAATAAIVRDAAAVLEPGGLLALEVDARRARAARDLAAADSRYRDVQIRPDLTGRDRFVVARRA